MRPLSSLLISIFLMTILIPELPAQYVPAGTVSTGVQLQFQQTKDRFTQHISYFLHTGLSVDYYLLNNFGTGLTGAIELSDNSTNYQYGLYARLFIIRGLFVQGGFMRHGGDDTFQSVPLSIGYGAIFDSGFSIEPYITYDLPLTTEIHARLALGIGARYYFKTKK